MSLAAAQLRTLILQNADPVQLQAALDLLRNGNGLTAPQSGTIAYDPIGGATVRTTLVGEPKVFFDGFYYTVFLFVSSGG